MWLLDENQEEHDNEPNVKCMVILNKKVESLNKLVTSHWSYRHSEKKQWMRLIKFEGFGGNLPRFDVRVRMSILCSRKRLLDHDNFVGGCKPILDALKSLKIIKDDSPRWIRASYRQVKFNNEYTIITIEEDLDED